MQNQRIPFQTIDWKNIPSTEHQGETGIAYWQTLQFPGLRVRSVECSAKKLSNAEIPRLK